MKDLIGNPKGHWALALGVVVHRSVGGNTAKLTAKNAKGAKNIVAPLCVLCELCGDLNLDRSGDENLHIDEYITLTIKIRSHL